MKTDQTNEEKESIVRLTLYPSQAKQFWPLLEDGLNRTGISGILCTINRSQDLNDGHLFLELQAAVLDGPATCKIQQLIAESRKESSDAPLRVQG